MPNKSVSGTGKRYIQVGEASRSPALGRDVTERKRMEDELQRYSTHLEELVAERITGYSREELEGRNWFEVIVPKDRYPQVWREFERLTAGGLPKNFENPILTKSGEERYIVWQNNEVHEQGQIVGTISFGIDITDRKRVEEQLRAARERLEYVIASNPAVIFTGRLRPDLSDYDPTYMSKRTVELTGFEPEEFINHQETWQRHINPDDYRGYTAALPRLWKTGHFDVEYHFLRKDGKEVWLREEARLVRDAAGKPLEVIGYWTEVSERKRLEEELAKSHRLATIGEMAAMVGHDLRNPLQAITGTLYLAKKLSRSEKVEDRKEVLKLLDTIEDQIPYMDKIVSDLQSYAGPVQTEPVQTNLPRLIREVIGNAHLPGNVETHVTIPEDLTSVMVDRVLLQRVLANLIINAVQAMPKGGDVTMTAKKEKESLTVTVEDAGEGIPAENLDKIFTPFFTTKAQGQGLGLAVCKRLVEAQDGTITITSEVGKGSTFTVTIPTNRTSGSVQVGEETDPCH